MTRITGLLGYPTEHSLSPNIHHYWFEQYNLDGEYHLYSTPPEELQATLAGITREAIGVNVTIPYKQAVIPYLDRLDALAEQAGAVNTIRREAGEWIGCNTDVYGFITNLREGMTGDIHGDIAHYLDHAVILGAGGATRAIIVALFHAGVKRITVTNRTLEKSLALVEAYGVEMTPWENRHAILSDATLLVNTTSLGMIGQPPLEIDLTALPVSALVHDIVYLPLETSLLEAARVRGNPTVDGLGMLLYQAQQAFALWHGIVPEVTGELRAIVLGRDGDDDRLQA